MPGFGEMINRRIVQWLYQKRVVYHLPGMEQITPRKDLIYKAVGGQPLELDVYFPAGSGEGEYRPAVLVVHGNAEPNVLRYAKDWGQYISWAQLLAASGFVAVVFNHRSLEQFNRLPESAADLADAVDFTRRHASELGIDRERLGLLAFSAGVPFAARYALKQKPEFLRAVACYYGPFDFRHLRLLVPPQVSDETLEDFSPVTYLESVKTHTPAFFIAKAGRDGIEQNESIDRFTELGREAGLEITLEEYPAGEHSFDLVDKKEASQEIIRHTLDFFQTHLTG